MAPAKHDPPVNVIEDDDIMDPGEEPIDPSLRHIIERVGNRSKYYLCICVNVGVIFLISIDLNKSSLDSEQASTSSVTIRVSWIYPPGPHRPAPKQWVFNIRKV